MNKVWKSFWLCQMHCKHLVNVNLPDLCLPQILPLFHYSWHEGAILWACNWQLWGANQGWVHRPSPKILQRKELGYLLWLWSVSISPSCLCGSIAQSPDMALPCTSSDFPSNGRAEILIWPLLGCWSLFLPTPTLCCRWQSGQGGYIWFRGF